MDFASFLHGNALFSHYKNAVKLKHNLNVVQMSQKKNFPLRISTADRDEYDKLALQLSQKAGKSVRVSDVLRRAIEYGLPILQREANHDLPEIELSMTVAERAVIMAKHLIDLGYSQLQNESQNESFAGASSPSGIVTFKPKTLDHGPEQRSF